MKRNKPLTQQTPMKRTTPMMRGKPMTPLRASMKARKAGKKPPKTVYRNAALLDLASGKPCLLRVPNFCVGTTETTVACHSNRLRDGKGKGIKAHDWAAAWGCVGCHWFIDQSTASKAEKLSFFVPGLARTRLAIIALGRWPEEAERGYQLLYGESP